MSAVMRSRSRSQGTVQEPDIADIVPESTSQELAAPRTPPCAVRSRGLDQTPDKHKDSENVLQAFSKYVQELRSILQVVTPPFLAKGILLSNRFDDEAFLHAHQDILRCPSPEVILLGINPTSSGPLKGPFDKRSPSGYLMNKFLEQVDTTRIMLWNICPGVSFTSGAHDVSYDDVLVMQAAGMERLHNLNVILMMSILEAKKQSLKCIWALGKHPLFMLQQLHTPPGTCVVGTAHPAHFLRTCNSRQKAEDAFLASMQAVFRMVFPDSIANFECSVPRPMLVSDLRMTALFSNQHKDTVEAKALLKLVNLPPELQAMVIAQGSLNKLVFKDSTATLISRVQKARSCHFASVCKLLELECLRSELLQEHVAWAFMELGADRQQQVMARTFDGVRNMNGALWKRIKGGP